MAAEWPAVALVYDFDGTLSPLSMQEYGCLAALGQEPNAFWQEINGQSREKDVNSIYYYLWRLVELAKEQGIAITRDSLNGMGRSIDYFPGVETWFSLTRAIGEECKLRVQHYIVSSGIEEILEGCSIYNAFDKVFASSYLYNEEGRAVWPRLAMDYTLKTQFLFRISKGVFSLSDDKAINDFMPDSKRPIPVSRMIYFGDGQTDIPCMRLVKAEGGYSIAVYNPERVGAADKARSLHSDGRVQFIAPADYREGQPLHRIVSLLLRLIAQQHYA